MVRQKVYSKCFYDFGLNHQLKYNLNFEIVVIIPFMVKPSLCLNNVHRCVWNSLVLCQTCNNHGRRYYTATRYFKLCSKGRSMYKVSVKGALKIHIRLIIASLQFSMKISEGYHIHLVRACVRA